MKERRLAPSCRSFAPSRHRHALWQTRCSGRCGADLAGSPRRGEIALHPARSDGALGLDTEATARFGGSGGLCRRLRDLMHCAAPWSLVGSPADQPRAVPELAAADVVGDEFGDQHGVEGLLAGRATYGRPFPWAQFPVRLKACNLASARKLGGPRYDISLEPLIRRPPK